MAAIVVNWNQTADTLRAVASLKDSEYPELDILVVDNGSLEAARHELSAALLASTPDSRDDGVRGGSTVGHRANTVAVVELDQNSGFTGGYNRGLSWATQRGADYALLLNDDAVIERGGVAALVTAAEQYTEAALFGPLLLTVEDPTVILSAGGRLLPGACTEHRGLGETDRGQFADTTPVDYLSGCCVLVRCRALEQIGVLDDAFFAYWEDVEWAVRARRSGWSSLLVPAARAYHPDTRRRDDRSPQVVYYLVRNQVRFAQKTRAGTVTMIKVILRHLRTLTSWSLRPHWRHKRAQRDALARALWDAARGYGGAMPTGMP